MICDYYLKLLLEPDDEDRIISFEEWERKNHKRLRGKSDKEKNIIWQQEEIVGKKKKEISISKDKDIHDFYPNSDDLQNLPQNSTLIKISFILKKPYTSKDEGEFHIIGDDYLFSWGNRKQLINYLKKKYGINLKYNYINVEDDQITFRKDDMFGIIFKEGIFAHLKINNEMKDSFIIEQKNSERKLYAFRIFENPIVKDKFTGLPMVRPSTWKGHLRFAADRVECEECEKKEIIKRIFGTESEDGKALKGRLYFFPTFFKEKEEKDVITPLDRTTRTPVSGRAPIPIEVMKPKSKGEFYLLYVPYPKGKDFKVKQVEEDLKFLAEVLRLMFYTYGFSAKKTSGFGVVEEKLNEGKIWINTPEGTKDADFHDLSELKDKITELFDKGDNNE